MRSIHMTFNSTLKWDGSQFYELPLCCHGRIYLHTLLVELLWTSAEDFCFAKQIVIWWVFKFTLKNGRLVFLQLSAEIFVSKLRVGMTDSVADQNKQKVRRIWKQQQLHGGHKINSRMWSKFIFQWQSKNIQQNLKKNWE